MKRFEELITLVREKGVVFELLTHRPAKTCRETTQITGGAVEQGGKALVCYADSIPIMVVLPCSKRLNFQKFKTLFGFRNLRLATGAEVKKLTGLEVGSIPPFGFLFDLPTYTEKSLSVVFLMNMKLDRNLDPVSKSPLFFVRVGELVFLGLLLVIPGTNFYSNINLDPKTKGVNEIEKLIPTSEYPVNKTGVELGGLSAEAAIVMDIDSAVMLYEKNSRERLYPASTTKMMTAVIAIENYPLEKVVGVGKFDVPQYKIGLMEGENISVENLLYGTLVASGNDAAEALASTFPGGRDEFILAMNQKAKELHLLDTQFRNPTGVDEEGHFSTALDLGRLAIYALGEPVFSRIVATQKTSVYSEDGKIEHKLSNINSGEYRLSQGIN